MIPLMLMSSAAPEVKICEGPSQLCTAASLLLPGCLALLQLEAIRSSKVYPELLIASAPLYCVRGTCSLWGAASMLRSMLWPHLHADSAAAPLLD